MLPVRRALAGISETQFGSPGDAQLLIGEAAKLPPSQIGLTWLGIGPIDGSEAARKQAKDFVGPYLLEKRHPLLDGVVLGGVVFGGVQPVAVAGKQLEATPLVSAGKQLLLSRLAGTQTAAYLLNLDFARSNLAESPDWPILVKNLVELCRDALPGLKRWNYRLNEEITFRPNAGDHGSDPLSLVFASKNRAAGPRIDRRNPAIAAGRHLRSPRRRSIAGTVRRQFSRSGRIEPEHARPGRARRRERAARFELSSR